MRRISLSPASQMHSEWTAICLASAILDESAWSSARVWFFFRMPDSFRHLKTVPAVEPLHAARKAARHQLNSYKGGIFGPGRTW